MRDLLHYSVDERLLDGETIRIRAIRPDDKQRLFEHFSGLSSDAVYHRFFGFKHTLTIADLSHLTDLDLERHVGLAATLIEDGQERFIGVGRYICNEHGRHRAEVAFAVLDAYQGRGIGSLLLAHLSRIAHECGVGEFTAEVMGDNTRMLNVFAQREGLSKRIEDGAVHVSFPTHE